MHAYTPVPTDVPATVNLPDDDDDDEAAVTVNPPLEAAFDALAYEKKNNYFRAVDPWMVIPLGPPVLNASSRWAWSQIEGIWIQTDTTDEGDLYWPVFFPPVGNFLRLEVALAGIGFTIAAGHGALPATKPAVGLYRQHNTGAAMTQIGAVADASANAAAYDASHVLGFDINAPTGFGTASTDQWYLRVRGETGANAVNNTLALSSARVRLHNP